MGIITSTAKFSDCNKVTVSAFCRRRLPIVMCRLKMAETVKEAVTFVEQGHVRVGPETITDPAFLVTRNMEDFVTWVDTSKIKRKILKYNDKVELSILLGATAELPGWILSVNVYHLAAGRFRLVVDCYKIMREPSITNVRNGKNWCTNLSLLLFFALKLYNIRTFIRPSTIHSLHFNYFLCKNKSNHVTAKPSCFSLCSTFVGNSTIVEKSGRVHMQR